ncbi:phosphoribosyltransferase family protein [Undibacterium rivi]|nr:phosphoribosyltransferase family protein [Undibacterium rivi]
MMYLQQIWRKSWQASLAQLLPCSCALCHAQNRDVICEQCLTSYFPRDLCRCEQCGLVMPPGANTPRCGDCLQNPPAFDNTIVACDYEAPQDRLVLSLKFGHHLALAPVFAAMLRDAILHQQHQELPDWLCVVPLSHNRLTERGFNQALEIARPLALHLGIPLHPQALRKTRETAKQSSLAPDARMRNVKNAFVPDDQLLQTIKGRHIGIVDDVITTGMTLHEIATMLKRFGARKVSNYVFARTPHHIY